MRQGLSFRHRNISMYHDLQKLSVICFTAHSSLQPLPIPSFALRFLQSLQPRKEVTHLFAAAMFWL